MPDVGGRSSFVDDCAAVSDLYIRGARVTGVTMPWETPLMKQIFGDLGPSVSLSMPLDWGSSDLPSSGVSAGDVEQPLIPSQCRWSCAQYVIHKTDETYLQQKDRTMNSALAKWKFLVLLDPACSEVGRQIEHADDDQAALVLSSVMGVKSPNTVLKRAGALMMYYRWNAVHGSCPMLPFAEHDIWCYVMQQSATTSSASRSHSLVQSLRFAHYVMGFDGALACASSRRVLGQSQLQMAVKEPTRQARPLTVLEVKRLHSIADGHEDSAVDKCIASGLLLLLYGRCRVSDANYIHEVLHDVSGETGFLEVTTRFHKSARTAQQKALLLPILMSSAGVVDFPWVHSWIANRKACGLATSGLIQGALLPAPILGDHVSWMKRPLSPGEVTSILKGFLGCDDALLSSHSLKATTLSWAPKAEVPREQRRILGRHSSAIQCADSFYSRDMSVGPVNSLQKVIRLIKDGTFCPDATRANYFPNSAAGQSAGTPAHVVMQPFTPAFAERGQPGTPVTMTPLTAGGRGKQLDESQSATAVQQVKSESSWTLLPQGKNAEVIELSSDSDCDSSESASVANTTDQDEAIDLDPEGSDLETPAVETVPSFDEVVARNDKTKIVHECRDKVMFAIDTQQIFQEVMKGTLTKCGRVINESYKLVNVSFDWTAKCRVCFKGRRAPLNSFNA